MKRQPIIIAVVVALVLVPMWGIAWESGNGHEPTLLSTKGADIHPTATLVPLPTDIKPNTAGILSWVGLLALVGILLADVRWILNAHDGEPIEVGPGDPVPPDVILDEHRRLVSYTPPSESGFGLALLGLFALVSVTAAGLLAYEVILGAASTQFIGLFATLLFLGLAEVVTTYAAYFMPRITVAEERTHVPAGPSQRSRS